MLILKIPCVLVAAIGIHKALTAPGESLKHDRTPYSGVLALFLHLGVSNIWIIKGVYWAVALAEIVAVMAKVSTSDVSAHILSALSVDGSLGDLRLTQSFVVGMVCISLGSLIRIICFRALKKFFTFEASISKNHQLVTTGPYGIVRHPSYVGLLLIDVGMIFWFGSRGSFLRESGVLAAMQGKLLFGAFVVWMQVIVVALLRRATVEDNALREKFRSEWEEWARRVPYAFFPGIY
ncbi:hypothetical protein L208DRAFT_1449941 [Tricholoma matsutake]|nr:hypothetical protein L208DRAFT_1449941 [Tricholoma matsutake 945]